MEAVVAIKVVDEKGIEHFFMTWGRVFNAVDPEPLFRAIKPYLPKFGVSPTSSMTLCESLREASSQRYFYEALFFFGQTKIPFGDEYSSWCEQQCEKIECGKEIYYLGKS